MHQSQYIMTTHNGHMHQQWLERFFFILKQRVKLYLRKFWSFDLCLHDNHYIFENKKEKFL